MSDEADVFGKRYKFRKLDVFDQADVLFDLGEIVAEFFKMKEAALKLKDNPEKLFEMIVPVFSKISQIPKEKRKEVIMTLLSVVEIKQAKNWASLVSNGSLMFPLELPAMLNLAGRSFMFHIRPFLDAIPASSSEPG